MALYVQQLFIEKWPNFFVFVRVFIKITCQCSILTEPIQTRSPKNLYFKPFLENARHDLFGTWFPEADKSKIFGPKIDLA